MNPLAVQVTSIAALWLLLMSSSRFTASMSLAMRPLASAAYRVIRFKMTGLDARREWASAFDTVYMRVNIALVKPWAMVLLLGGMLLMGAGYGFGSAGDAALLASTKQIEWLAFMDRYMDWASAVLGCVGMAAGLAAINPKPAHSALTSLGFSLAGVGIGITASLYF